MKHVTRNVFFVLLCTFCYLQVRCQSQPFQLTAKIKKQLVQNIGDSIKAYYVYPDTALKMAAFIKQQLYNHAYDTIKTPSVFAAALTKDIYSVYRDLHMRVNFYPQVSQNAASQNQEVQKQNQDFKTMLKKTLNMGFVKTEVLPGGVGYLDIRVFVAPDDESTAIANAALRLVSNSDVLIIDLRKNMGGSPRMVQYLCNFLFRDSTHINDLYTRYSNSLVSATTTPDKTFKALNIIPIYVLTSHKTYSGAEELAYDLQAQKRAVIVGEVTGGAAHPVGPWAVGNGFEVSIPFARAINPITKTNWEGVGVKPDIEVPADKALDAALEQIKKAKPGI